MQNQKLSLTPTSLMLPRALRKLPAAWSGQSGGSLAAPTRESAGPAYKVAVQAQGNRVSSKGCRASLYGCCARLIIRLLCKVVRFMRKVIRLLRKVARFLRKVIRLLGKVVRLVRKAKRLLGKQGSESSQSQIRHVSWGGSTRIAATDPMTLLEVVRRDPVLREGFR